MGNIEATVQNVGCVEYSQRLARITNDKGTFGLEIETFAFGGTLPIGAETLSGWEEHSCSELMLNVSIVAATLVVF